MKKIIIRKKDCLYVTKNADGIYCDFCGVCENALFESEWENKNYHSKSNMQICTSCVEQLYKLITKKS